ncbi:uncharacterized protein LOC121047258 [Ixodes scapularis]|uniref:uncharacterized protein LOC121047258 n=1 Tax=Ixodes scapularis TaxID=6945 RepID=UPI001C390FF1|nr:uncharacterized protein LOC121047258 [Ixodes scapularis]
MKPSSKPRTQRLVPGHSTADPFPTVTNMAPQASTEEPSQMSGNPNGEATTLGGVTLPHSSTEALERETAGDVTKVSVALQTSFSGPCVLQPDSARAIIDSLERQLQSARKKITALVADKSPGHTGQPRPVCCHGKRRPDSVWLAACNLGEPAGMYRKSESDACPALPQRWHHEEGGAALK